MYTTKTADSILIKNYINGNEHALELLLTKHKNQVFNFIFSKVLNKNIAEDIFQEVFIKIIQTLKSGKYNEEGKFLPWTMRIARNLIIDHFRKSNRISFFKNNGEFDIFSVIEDTEYNIENKMIQSQVQNDLKKLIEQLPDDQKTVLKLRMYNDLSFKEISENTNVSINTALGRMRYALTNLRKLIESHEIALMPI